MSFTLLFDATSNATASANTQGVNALQAGANGMGPNIHIVTYMVNGDFDGATVHAVIGPNASATASSPWNPVADSTVAANSAVGLELPNGCFYGFVITNESVSTSVRVYAADSHSRN